VGRENEIRSRCGSKSVIVSNAASSPTATAAGAIAVFDGNALSKESNKKLDAKGLEVVGMREPSKNAIAVAHRFERRNPVTKTVASLFKILRSQLTG